MEVNAFSVGITEYDKFTAHSVIWGPSCKMKTKSYKKNSERFKRFLRPILGNTASLVYMLSTVCEIKGFVNLNV